MTGQKISVSSVPKPPEAGDHLIESPVCRVKTSAYANVAFNLCSVEWIRQVGPYYVVNVDDSDIVIDIIIGRRHASKHPHGLSQYLSLVAK